jgi:CRISPR/Cas system CSM-associated protein Csm3 (group 7 of RAMP superfamily)
MRFINKICINAELKNLTPLHIGGAENSFETDMPIIRDGDGKPYIPATSISGVIRDYLENLLGENDGKINLFLGNQDKNNKQIKSHLIIDDAVLLDNEESVEIRDHASVDRLTLSAADKGKFDEQIISAGSKFDFSMELNIDKNYEKHFYELLKLTLNGFNKGLIFIGGKSTRGFGRVKLEDIKVNKYDFEKEKKALDDYINGQENKFDYENEISIEEFKNQIKSYNYAKLNIKCKIPTGFLIKSGTMSEKDTDADMVQLESKNANGKIVPVIPGSSLKGIFRTRADMIIRTVKPDMKKVQKLNENELEKHLLQNKYLFKLFGTSIDWKSENIKIENEPYIKDEKGRIFFEDSYMYSYMYGNIKRKKTTHIKVDRFTGGAVDGALYDMETLWSENDDIYFDLNIMVKNAELRYLGLLGHCLKDLFTGDLKIGYGTRRGLGKVEFFEIKDIDIQIGDYRIKKEDLQKEDLNNPLNNSDFKNKLEKMSDEFNNWIIDGGK